MVGLLLFFLAIAILVAADRSVAAPAQASGWFGLGFVHALGWSPTVELSGARAAVDRMVRTRHRIGSIVLFGHIMFASKSAASKVPAQECRRFI
jgi:hypothetical protein